jgi:hypothetical protein
VSATSALDRPDDRPYTLKWIVLGDLVPTLVVLALCYAVFGLYLLAHVVATLLGFLIVIKSVRERHAVFMMQVNASDRPEDRPYTLEGNVLSDIVPGVVIRALFLKDGKMGFDLAPFGWLALLAVLTVTCLFSDDFSFVKTNFLVDKELGNLRIKFGVMRSSTVCWGDMATSLGCLIVIKPIRACH